MDDITRYKEAKQKAETINRKIATLEGSRNEVIRQLNELGLTPDTVEAEIKRLSEEIASVENEIKQIVDTLTQKIEETNKVLNQ